MVLSLAMVFDVTPEKTVTVLAPWLSEPIEASTFEEAYWAALAARSEPARPLGEAAR